MTSDYLNIVPVKLVLNRQGKYKRSWPNDKFAFAFNNIDSLEKRRTRVMKGLSVYAKDPYLILPTSQKHKKVTGVVHHKAKSSDEYGSVENRTRWPFKRNVLSSYFKNVFNSAISLSESTTNAASSISESWSKHKHSFLSSSRAYSFGTFCFR